MEKQDVIEIEAAEQLVSAGRIDTALEGVSLNNRENALDEVCELLERFENRLSLGSSSKPLMLAKRYIDNDLKLLVEARWGSVDFNIILERKNLSELIGGPRIDQEWNATGAGTCEAEVPVWSEKHSWDANLCRSLNDCGIYCYDGVVLIDNVEHVQNVERRVNSFARLQSKQELLGLGANATYFGNSSGFISVGAGLDRKPTVSIHLTPVRADQVADKVVKGAAEIMNGVSDDGAVIDWHAFRTLHAIDILSSIRVYFVGESVRVAVSASEKHRLKVLNVAFGPFEF